MNREIKFRAWDNENKYMVISKQGVFTALRNSMNIVRQDNGYYNDGDLLKPNKEKYILMQYTGLDDKNGKEIYEGDIVLYQDWEMAYEGGGNDSFINKGIVEYCEDNCCFNVTERQTVDLADVLYKDNEDLEVIGNIYDNPELLGGE